jgi:hypothetical protein
MKIVTSLNVISQSKILEMLLRILLACFGGLSNLLSDDLPLVGLVFFYCLP